MHNTQSFQDALSSKKYIAVGWTERVLVLQICMYELLEHIQQVPSAMILP